MSMMAKEATARVGKSIDGHLAWRLLRGDMTSFLYSRHIKIFDYAKVFAEPLRERIRQCAHDLADAHGVSIEHVQATPAQRRPGEQGDCPAREASLTGTDPFRDGSLLRL